MSLTVDALNKNIISGTSLNDIIKEQTLVIDKKILNANKTIGNNMLIYELPTVFPSLPISSDLVQLIVYASLCESLDRRGFKTRVKLMEGKSQLIVNWTVAIDSQEVSRLEAYLKTKIVK